MAGWLLHIHGFVLALGTRVDDQRRAAEGGGSTLGGSASDRLGVGWAAGRRSTRWPRVIRVAGRRIRLGIEHLA